MRRWKKVNKNYLTTNDIAEKLGFTTKAVTLWIKEGKLKAYRFGKDYRITEEDFNDFLEKSQVTISQDNNKE